MKGKRSILTFVLAGSLATVNLMPVTALADTINYKDVIVKVNNLGLLQGTNPDSLVTRGQLAKALVELNNLEDYAKTTIGSTSFSDVRYNDPLSGYVNTVTSKGLMFGMADGKFHPEGGVSFGDFCTILVKVLGYTDQDVQGVWPYNYMNKAYDLGLTSGISLKRKDNVTVGTAAVMFDRLLATKLKTDASKTLNDAMNLYTSCIIYDNSSTSTSLAPDAVSTDKGIFNVADPSIKLEVGNKYRLVIENNTIVKSYGLDAESTTISVKNFVDNVIYYDENGVEKTTNAPSNIAYYYHGVKQEAAAVSNIIKKDSIIVLVYNSDKTAYQYGVIIDPVYSTPEVAFDVTKDTETIGKINISDVAKIIRDGQEVSKADIEDYDVVYKVTDYYGKNSFIEIYSSKAEGNITAITSNSVTIDSKNYSFSKYITSDIIKQFAIGDKVTALLGNDGKIADIRKTSYKIGNEIEAKVIGNSKTIETLSDNQVLTDVGTYYLLDNAGTVDIGQKYLFNVDGDTIVKVKQQKNTLEGYGVRAVVDSTVYYSDGKSTELKSVVLPNVSTYYYQGVKVDYNTALKALKMGSSIVLSKNSEGVYEYGVVADPIYSKPIISNYANSNIISNLNMEDYLFLYKDGGYYSYLSWIKMDDVVYTVSDLWGTTKFIYVNNNQLYGKISAVAPNPLTPKTLQIGSTTYSVSKYFDTRKFGQLNLTVGNYVTITLDKDGNIIDIRN